MLSALFGNEFYVFIAFVIVQLHYRISLDLEHLEKEWSTQRAT
jgi:hypothetical protein